MQYLYNFVFGPRQANLLLIAYASSEGSGEPAHPRSLARTFAARSYKQWVKRNLQTESQIPGPSEWLGMRSWNLSWRNARRHKFAWRGSFGRIADFDPLNVAIIIAINISTNVSQCAKLQCATLGNVTWPNISFWPMKCKKSVKKIFYNFFSISSFFSAWY